MLVLWEPDGPVLVGGRLNLNCPKMLYFTCFWVFLGVFKCFWVFWMSGAPVLVGGDVDVKCLKLGDLGLFLPILVYFGVF